MKHIWFFWVLLITTAPVWAVQEDPPGKSFKETIKCEDRIPKGQNGKALPPWISQQDVVKKLHPSPILDSDESFERICGILAHELSSQPGNTAVFLVYQQYSKNRSGGYMSSDLQVEVGIVSQDEKPRWIASTSEPIQLKDAKISALDAASYQVTPKTTAFGIRWQQSFGYAGGGGANQYLDLFIVDREVVKPVMSTLIWSSSLTAGEWHKDGTRDHWEHGSTTPAKLSVLKTKTGGYFDLLKKRGKRQAILKWDGEQYVLKGKDPVPNVNVE